MTVVNRAGWLVAISGFCHLTITFGIISSFVVLFVSLEEEFGSSAVATGWMGSLAWGVTSMFSPISMLLLARMGHRALAILGVILCTGGLLVTAYLPTLWSMYISFGLVFSAGTNMVMFVVYHLLSLHYPDNTGTRQFALVGLSGGVALLAGTALIDLLIDEFGWRITYPIFSGIVLVVCLPLCFVLKTPVVESVSQDLQETGKVCDNLDPGPVKRVHEKVTPDIDLKTSSTHLVGSLPVSHSETDEVIQPVNDYTEHHEDPFVLPHDTTSSCLSSNHGNGHIASKNTSNPLLREQATVRLHVHAPSVNSNNEIRYSVLASTDPPKETDSNGVSSKNNLKSGGGGRSRWIFIKVPGAWMSMFGTLTTTLASVFNVINLVSFMTTISLDERTSRLLIMGLGLAEMFGRVVALVVGGSLPVAGITIMAGVNVAAAVASLFIGFFPTLATIALYIAVSGTARGVFYTINIPVSLALFPSLDRGVVITLLMVGNGLGGLLSSTFGGLSMDMTGSYQIAFFTCTGLYLTSSVIFGSLRIWPKLLVPFNSSSSEGVFV